MKTTAAPGASSVFELLDREKVWEWGESMIGFDTQVENYLAAVTEVGRRLAYRDRGGKWMSAYWWFTRTRSKLNKGKYSKEQRDILTTLPYFMSDGKAERHQRMVKIVLAFKLKHARLPAWRNRDESSVRYTYVGLAKAHREGRLSSDLLAKLEENGIFLNTSRSPSMRLAKIEHFVTRHQRRPTQNRSDTDERRLYASLWKLHRRSAKGLLSPEDTRRLQDLERKTKAYDKQNKRI